jgi:DNA-binding MarR family transcriptional regulator
MNINKEIEKIMKDDDQPFIHEGKYNPWYLNNNLSLPAYGLMAYLWDLVGRTNTLKLKVLTINMGFKEKAINTAIDELIKEGYLQISKVPVPKKVYRFDIFRNKYRTSSRYTSKDLL